MKKTKITNNLYYLMKVINTQNLTN